jgi:hypothetical protein
MGAMCGKVRHEKLEHDVAANATSCSVCSPAAESGGGSAAETAKAAATTKARSATRVSLVIAHYASRLGGPHDDGAAYAERLMSGLAGPSRDGLCVAPPEQRCRFVSLAWMPFLLGLEKLAKDVRFRAGEGFAAEHTFSLRGRELFELQQRNLRLTEHWYGAGRGNLSALYAFFVTAMVDSAVVAFRFGTIPMARSADGFAECVDTTARAKAGAVLRTRNSAHVSRGGMSQHQGESAIDNTVLVNVVARGEARRLLAGRIVRRALVFFVRVRQRQLLRRVASRAGLQALDPARYAGAPPSDPLLHHPQGAAGALGMYPSAVRAALGALRGVELAAWGIDAAGPSWRCLCTTGALLADWGQMPPDCQVRAEQEAEHVLAPPRRASVAAATGGGGTGDTGAGQQGGGEGEGGGEGAGGEFGRLLRWCREHPGRFLCDDRPRHMLALVAGLWADKIAVITRSQMERLTLAKYVPVAWRRQVPLVAVELPLPAEGGGGEGGVGGGSAPVVRVVRRAGVLEHSRIRANECPYFEAHGMSLCGGGYLERERSGQLLSRYSVVKGLRNGAAPHSSSVIIKGLRNGAAGGGGGGGRGRGMLPLTDSFSTGRSAPPPPALTLSLRTAVSNDGGGDSGRGGGPGLRTLAEDVGDEGEDENADEGALGALAGGAAGWAAGARRDGQAGRGMALHRQQLALLHELNLPVDPSERVGNWHLTDVEKVMQEAKVLAPCCPLREAAGGGGGGQAAGGALLAEQGALEAAADGSDGRWAPQLLPGDACFNVGQNPKVGSSIGPTQHTQIVAGDAQSVGPIYGLPGAGPPQPCAALGAAAGGGHGSVVAPTVEIVPVGADADSFYLRVLCVDPAAPPLLRMLTELRVHLLRRCVTGRPTDADFMVRCLSDGGRRFVCTFAPLAAMRQEPVPDGGDGGGGGGAKMFVNPTTGADSRAAPELSQHKVDFAMSGGRFLVPAGSAQWRGAVEGGRDAVLGVYNFCRLRGARALTEAFLEEGGFWARGAAHAQA